MLHERERTIAELRETVDALTRRCGKLQAALVEREGGGAEEGMLQEAVARQNEHFKQYKQIRSDYRRLLKRRVDTVRRTGGAAKEAKAVVAELHGRLNKEIEERETEAALMNAKLYETEQKQSDWYVERRLLEQKVAKLDAEIRERDQLDGQIETCVCSLFERMRMLEQTNKQLSDQLGVPSAAPDAAAEAGGEDGAAAFLAKAIPGAAAAAE
mmetsp:Transcript_14831/g.50966  ORF Transcript_14831/g.50966 Transcript_14831/m.50966 type:complete len:213 (-) Transcript_14831:516-1154(-)